MPHIIFTRRVGERIRIGDDVIIEVKAVRGDRVKFGIEAPKNVKVNRGEIHDRMQEGKEKSGEP